MSNHPINGLTIESCDEPSPSPETPRLPRWLTMRHTEYFWSRLVQEASYHILTKQEPLAGGQNRYLCTSFSVVLHARLRK